MGHFSCGHIDVVNFPILVHPQSEYLRFRMMAAGIGSTLACLAEKLYRLSYVANLIIFRRRISGTIVMAHNGNSDRIVIFNRNRKSFENRLNRGRPVLLGQNQIGPRFGNRVNVLSVESFLQISNDRQ